MLWNCWKYQNHRLDRLVFDISPLSGLTNLTTLTLRYNLRIADIRPLSGLTRLTDLSLDWNQITDISPLSGLTDLAKLYLAHNQISDLKPLVDNPGLGEGDTVDVRENPLNDVSWNVYIPILQDRGVDVLL